MAVSVTAQNRIDVSNLYVALFARAPDGEGLGFWSNQLASGQTLAQVADTMFATAPARATYPSFATNAEIITSFYTKVLGRAPDTEGAAFWTGKLNATGATPGSVIAEMISVVNAFVASTPALPTDAAAQLSKDLFANKANVALYYGLTNGSVAGAQTALNGVDSTAASVTAAKAVIDGGAGANDGQTFTLTTSIDNITGTGGNDTFIGDNSNPDKTISAGDQVNGGGGKDILKLYAASGVLPTFSSIETVYLNGASANTNLSTYGDVTAVQLDQVTTGKIFTVGAAATALSVANQAAADTVEFKIAAAATDVNVTASGLGSLTTGAVVLKLDGAALTTVNLTSTGATANVIQLADGAAAVTDTVTKVTVGGTQYAVVDMKTGGFTKVTTVDASGNAAGVNAVLEDTTGANVTVTGGAGADTVNFGAKFNKSDKFNGGDGIDTLQMTQASVTTVQGYVAADKLVVNDNLSNIEVLKVTDALTSDIDASRFDSVNSVVLNAGYGVAAGTVTYTLSGVTSGVTVESNADAVDTSDILAVEITDATLAGNNSDTVNLKLNDKVTGGGAAVTDYGVLNGVGVDILNISSTKAATSTATGNLIDIAATSSALDKVVATGDLALDISTVALVNSIAEVDASGLVVSATSANGLNVTIATGGTNGVKITGSNGVDTIVGGDAADIILAGTGNDVITGGKGNDVLTGGAGNDIFNFAAADSGITASLFDTITDYTNGTVAGTTDTIDFTTSNGVAGTTALAGFTLNAGVAAKSGATVADFIAAVQAAGTANETYAFVSGSDTYVYNAGANGTTSTADDTFVKLVGLVGVSVVTVDTTVANEIVIA